MKTKSASVLSLLVAAAALAAAPLVLAADPAPAAPPAPAASVAPEAGARPRPMMQRMMHQRLEMLTEKLNLTGDQRTKIKAIWKQTGEQGKALREDTALTQEDRRTKAGELGKATREQVRAVLTPEQQKIFDQLPADRPGRKGEKKDDKS